MFKSILIGVFILRMLVNKFKIKAFCMSDIERMGIREVVRQTFEHLTIEYVYE